ncbi:hypothetical protein GCM10025331_68730 [Actinoplanes utahensis]|uniref:Uncharacterized protein n=1 Tax=Actinoplanes utahensis TaxID=1869 RepID=A0A0A6ULB7_ACTUT|nr:hypothetical protein MB27_24640 [Actinoplanes utahensis]GIF27053.1 hypothetical protein Aut01nite_00390 [Actinoplanes utahensis]
MLRGAVGVLMALSLPMTMEPGRPAAASVHGPHEPPPDDPFPRQVEISFHMTENTRELRRTDEVTFTATKREPCTPGGQCDYVIDEDSATVALEYDDLKFGCQGTASAPPFSWVRGRVGFDMQEDDGSHLFDFTIELDYATTRYRCDDGTSGGDGGNSSNGSTDAGTPWTPGQEESLAVPVSSFPDGTGYADVRYRY